jgi:transcriptional regulator GlxA family with amidase domain
VIDRRPSRPLVFDRGVDLAGGVGAHARHVLQFLVDCLHRDSAILEHPLLRAGFDDMVVSAILALPNNYRDEIGGLPRASAAPSTVRRAEEFMEAHATEGITVSELVVECGCSRSALYDAFRRFRGYTPMQFLIESRLKSAREALQFASPQGSVTSIAYACGFPHLGRFSDTYRRRFGENPSETLRRGGLTGGS